MKQVNWFERKFEFSGKENILPSLIERLEGTPIRLKEKMKAVDPVLATIKPGGKWSIAEHIGHLADLEPLWQGRLEDILNQQEEMRPTDLTNRKTEEANHNAYPLAELLQNFTMLRQATLKRLLSLKEEDVFKSALHPRLKTPMRVIDLFTFVAEHDDHHLAKMTEIIHT
jgi:uncharacterized damage-inducible protein DinB